MMCRNCFCCCLPGCLLALLLPALGLFMLLRVGSERPSDVPPARVYSGAEIQHAEHQMAALEATARHNARLARQGRRVPFKLALTEDDLNAYLQSPHGGGSLARSGFDAVRVELGDGTVAFQGGVPAAGRRLWVRAEGRLVAGQGGRVYFDPRNFELGRLRWALPAGAADPLRRDLTSRSRPPVLRVPGEIQKITVTPGKVVIRGVTDPRDVEPAPGGPETRSGGLAHAGSGAARSSGPHGP